MGNKKIIYFLIAFLAVVISKDTIFAYDGAETIKIGYTYNYGTIKEPIIKHSEGFGYEYFKEISKYTDHKYEYIPCTWDEGLAMLEAGEIDIFGPAEKTEDRMEDFLYSEQSFGSEKMIIGSLNDSEYMYEDFESMDGKRIRIEIGGAEVALLEAYMEENNLDLEFIYTDDLSDVEGLENDKYDLSLSSSLYFTEGLKTNAILGVEPFYYMTNKNNEKLMNEIDKALDIIFTKDFLFFYDLYDKYFGNALVAKPALSKLDIELLNKNKTFKVGYHSEYDPIQYLGDDNTPQGISIQIMQLLIQDTGISFEYIPVDLLSEEEIIELDINLDTSNAYDFAKMSRQSEPYSQLLFMSVLKRNEDELREQTIGVTKYYYLPSETIQNIIPNASIKMHENLDSVIESLNNGTLDGAIVSEPDSAILLDKVKIKEYSAYSLDVEFPLSLTFADTMSIEYVNLFNKMICSLDETKVEAIFLDASRSATGESVIAQFLHNYTLELAITILLFIVLFVSSIAVISILKRKALNKIINEDSLTGLLTEYKLIQEAQKLLKRAMPNEYVFICLDIDNFQYINEVYGYKNGSLVLKYLADQLTSYCNVEDLIARTNADKFAVLKKKSSYEDVCCNSVFCENSTNPKLVDVLGENYALKISQGVYEISDTSLDITYMLDCAGSARQKSKGEYGNTLTLFTEEMSYKRGIKNKIVNNMEKALVGREFQVYYQPKINLLTKKIVGAEALVRWVVPTEGVVGPDNFIPLFEENGFVKKLDLFVFEEVCKFIVENSETLEIPIISSNFSYITLMSEDIIDSLLSITKKYNISPSLLEIEITESVFSENANNLIHKIGKLKKCGFLISMDDFGSGVSSLNRLKDIELNIIKIDRVFLRDTLNGEKGVVIIKNIINLAKNLQLSIIAEGVETKEHVDLLTKLNCDLAQGYYFAKPMCQDEFVSIIKNPPDYQ